MQAEDADLEPIWILDDGRALGGGQLFNLRLGDRLAARATIACPDGSPIAREARAAGLMVAGVPFPAPHVRHLPALAAASLRLRRLVPPNAIVVSGAIRTMLVASLARLPNPTVALMHERASASRLSVRFWLRNCRAVIVVGSESAAEYHRSLPQARVWAVNNFLSPESFSELGAQRALRTQTSEKRPVLGVLARLVPEKGVDVLIEELSKSPEAWAKLIVAGPRQDESHACSIELAIKRAHLQERVVLAGQVDDVPSFLSQLDALVVPSVGPEGQPTVILEGLAAGLPVVVRATMRSVDFVGLPVVAYSDSDDLRERLLHLPDAADPQVLSTRFGVEQVLETLHTAIDSARLRR